jgi:glutamate 5-kinase
VHAGGHETVIASGENPAALYDILQGKPVGTRFCAENVRAGFAWGGLFETEGR